MTLQFEFVKEVILEEHGQRSPARGVVIHRQVIKLVCV